MTWALLSFAATLAPPVPIDRGLLQPSPSIKMYAGCLGATLTCGGIDEALLVEVMHTATDETYAKARTRSDV